MNINYDKFITACKKYDADPNYIYRQFPGHVKKGIINGCTSFQPQTVGDICACIGCTPEEITDRDEHRAYKLPLNQSFVELDEYKIYCLMANEGITFAEIAEKIGLNVHTIKGNARMNINKATEIAKALYVTLDDILWDGEIVC